MKKDETKYYSDKQRIKRAKQKETMLNEKDVKNMNWKIRLAYNLSQHLKMLNELSQFTKSALHDQFSVKKTKKINVAPPLQLNKIPKMPENMTILKAKKDIEKYSLSLSKNLKSIEKITQKRIKFEKEDDRELVDSNAKKERNVKYLWPLAQKLHERAKKIEARQKKIAKKLPKWLKFIAPGLPTIISHLKQVNKDIIKFCHKQVIKSRNKRWTLTKRNKM